MKENFTNSSWRKTLIIILFGVKYKYTGGMAYEINYCYRKF